MKNLSCQGMIGNSNRHRIEAGRYKVRHLGLTRQNKCERSRPETVREFLGSLWNVARDAWKLCRRGQMDDEWIELRPILGREDAGNRQRTEGITGEAVDGLRGQADKPPLPQNGNGC